MRWLRCCFRVSTPPVNDSGLGVVASGRADDLQPDLQPEKTWGPFGSLLIENKEKGANGLQAGVANVCTSLASMECYSWSDRLSFSIDAVSGGLADFTSLVVFSGNGRAWLFCGSKPNVTQQGDGWLDTLCEQLSLKQLKEVYVIVQTTCQDLGAQKPLPSVSLRAHPLALSPGELLALPIYHQGQRLAAALLLGWTATRQNTAKPPLQPPLLALLTPASQPLLLSVDSGRPHTATLQTPKPAFIPTALQSSTAIASITVTSTASGPRPLSPSVQPPTSLPYQQQQQHLRESLYDLRRQQQSPGATELSEDDVLELQRLAQFLGYGLFADPNQSRFLAQVAWHLSTIAASLSLYDLVCAVLEAVRSLLNVKLSLHAQPLLVATTAAVAASGSTGVNSPAVVFSLRKEQLQHRAPAATLTSPASLAAPHSGPPEHHGSAPHALPSAAAALAVGGHSHQALLAARGSSNGGGGVGGSIRLPYASAQALANSAVAPDSGAHSRFGRMSSIASLRLMGGPGEADGGSGGGMGGMSGKCGSSEPSRIKAVRTALPRTLLLKALRASAQQQPPGPPSPPPPSASQPPPTHHLPNNQLPHSQPLQATPSLDASAGTAAALLPHPQVPTNPLPNPFSRSPTGRAPPSTLVVPDSGAHLLEEQQLYRDVLLASDLLGTASPGSMVLSVEGPPPPTPPPPPAAAYSAGVPSAASASAAGFGTSGTASCVPSAATALTGLTGTATTGTGMGTVNSLTADGGMLGAAGRSPPAPCIDEDSVGCVAAGGSVGGHRVALAAAAAAAAAAAPPPVQLGVYLVFPEVLPGGLLELVAAELRPVTEHIFGAFRTALSASSSGGGGRVAADWRSLYEQLTGKVVAGGAVPSVGSKPALGSLLASGGGGSLGAQQSPLCRALSGGGAGGHLTPGTPNLNNAGHGAVSECGGAQKPASCLGPSSPRLAAAAMHGGGGAAPTSVGGGAAAAAVGSYRALVGPPLRSAHSTAAPSGGLGGGAVGGGGAATPAGQAVARQASGGKWPASPLAVLQRRLAGLGVPPAPLGVAALLGGGGGGGVSPFACGMLDTAPMDLMTEGAAGGGMAGGSSLPRRGSPGWLLHSSPDVLLEEAAGGGGAEGAGGGLPAELLVSSLRCRLSAAMAVQEASEQARAQLSQDLAAVELLEVLGRGGQGVVFRGTLHGLEAAVKVLVQQPRQHQQQGRQGGGQGGQGGQRQQEQAGAEAGAGEAAEVAAEDGGGGGGGHGVGGEGKEAGGGGEGAEEGATLSRQARRGAMEVAVSSMLSHPNIVQVYATFSGVVVVRCHYRDSPLPVLKLCAPDDPMLRSSDPGPLNQVLCLEYCDAGTLLAAARAGAFRLACATGASNGAIWPALGPLYTSLLEVALALRHLHSRRLVHCDVKAANVLLKSSARDPRGWSCKLSDFGCVRLLNEAGPEGRLGFRVAHPLGTVGYMAPECFVKGALLGPEVDIYAFGVLMWEVLMSRTPYGNMNPQDVPRQVLRSHLRPVFHPLAPPPYCSLAVRCWSGSPRRRPSASDLVAELQQLLAEAQKQQLGQQGAAAAGGSGGGRPPPPLWNLAPPPQQQQMGAAARAAGAAMPPAAQAIRSQASPQPPSPLQQQQQRPQA